MRNFYVKSTVRGALAAAALALAVAACSPIIESHGYAPRAQELDTIRVGADTRATVQQKLGRPSTIGSFDDDAWYYISLRTEALAFYEPEIVEQRVVAIIFDEAGLVAEIGNYGLEDGRVIDLVTRETPTSGSRLSVIQQIFANVGRPTSGQILGQQ